MDSETAEEIKRHVTEGLRELGTELRTEIQEVRTELRTEIQEVRRHSGVLGEGLRELRAELRTEIQEVRRHSDVIAESLRGEIRLVAEGVAGLDEKFTLEFKNVREEIGEVKTLLRLSYDDLDRRIKPS